MDDLKYLHETFDAPPENQIKLIVVEDDLVLGKTIKRYLEKKFPVDVELFHSPALLLQVLPDINQPFCLITDISFDEGGVDGLLLIDLLKEKKIKFASIAMTGFASIETAIGATKKGVFQYLTKPFELESLIYVIMEAVKVQLGFELELTHVERSSNQPSARKCTIELPTADDIFQNMVGRSPAMKSVFERILKVAESDSTVFISGPSGTGKELVANAIHQLSNRNTARLVTVNCGAIPGELLESELFGHEKGSFTGAISARKGRFEYAHQGSIFLDEIGDMPLLLQVKLLRVLQARQIEPVGSNRTIDINVRIITATHRDLDLAVRDGNFREDLFYRLNVIPIQMPALSERREDIPLLIAYFLNKFVSADGRNGIEFLDETLELLMTYAWPGNVRELENLIERLVILRAGSVIKPSDLPAKFVQNRPLSYSDTPLIKISDNGIDLKQVVSEIEDSLILQALSLTAGNKNQASKLLGLNRTTLIEKMKKKGLDSFCQ